MKMLPKDFIFDIHSQIGCDLRTDEVTKILYSTDASIYQIEPIGVAFPRTQDELAAICEISYQYKIPILPRGSGSSLAGQAIGPALIIDCSRYVNRIVNINQDEKTAIVEPGLILSQLNKTLSKYGLQFGPDPASAERATMGGSLANNATGAHSIQYGMAVDHLFAAEVVLSDGSLACFNEVSLDKASKFTQSDSIESNLYKTALMIRKEFSNEVYARWPKTWRRVSGYNINYLIPWSSTSPPNWYRDDSNKIVRENENRFSSETDRYPPAGKDTINLAKIIAGSEGTLAVIKNATINLVELPRYTILGVVPYQNIAQACDDIPDLLLHRPSVIELIPNNLISLARAIPAYAHQLGFLDELMMHHTDKVALLVVEFSGDNFEQLSEKASHLGRNVIIAYSKADQQKIWGIRKAGLGILMSRMGDVKPISFIEDTAVPVEQLGKFVREMERIMIEHDTEADFYAHASAGCLHIRPLINLKREDGIKKLRLIAEATVDLTLRLGGAVSAEHGDGIARSEWLDKAYGPKILSAFRLIKEAIDPYNLLNPGKIIDPQPMDTNLRYVKERPSIDWQPVMNFSPKDMEAGILGLPASIEMCNGAGVCRKLDGVMCPSFQVTSDEMHSTRGRANLLRAMIFNRFNSSNMAQKVVFEALDYCLACKGCKAECPSAVDMAKLKYEYLNHYYRQPGNRRKLRDYLFGFIGNFLKWLSFQNNNKCNNTENL
jgi:FAD/FMN-containing dehydrogenase